MKFMRDSLTSLFAFLCKLFIVSPDKLKAGRWGNMPPPEGGVSSLGGR